MARGRGHVWRTAQPASTLDTTVCMKQTREDWGAAVAHAGGRRMKPSDLQARHEIGMKKTREEGAADAPEGLRRRTRARRRWCLGPRRPSPAPTPRLRCCKPRPPTAHGPRVSDAMQAVELDGATGDISATGTLCWWIYSYTSDPRQSAAEHFSTLTQHFPRVLLEVLAHYRHQERAREVVERMQRGACGMSEQGNARDGGSHGGEVAGGQCLARAGQPVHRALHNYNLQTKQQQHGITSRRLCIGRNITLRHYYLQVGM